MPTNKQRREAERRRLQRQLDERRQRQAARQKATLVASIIGTLVVIAAVVVTIVLVNSGDDKKTPAASSRTPSTSASTSATPTAASSSAAAVPTPTAPCATSTGKATVTFKGVTVGNATDLKVAPKVTSKAAEKPTTVQCADLVVGKGKAATTASTVTVQYAGVLYANGKAFDSSWSRGGKAVAFPLNQVIPGFTQGIGGAGKVAPMHVGGRRVMILPAALAYGSQAQSAIPANSVLVFVVDLTKVS